MTGEMQSSASPLREPRPDEDKHTITFQESVLAGSYGQFKRASLIILTFLLSLEGAVHA